MKPGREIKIEDTGNKQKMENLRGACNVNGVDGEDNESVHGRCV